MSLTLSRMKDIANYATKMIVTDLAMELDININDIYMEEAIEICNYFKSFTQKNRSFRTDIEPVNIRTGKERLDVEALAECIYLMMYKGLNNADVRTLQVEIDCTQMELIKWRKSFKRTSSIQSPEPISYNEKDLEILKSEVEILKNEMKILKLKIESLNQKNMSKKKTFSASQIKSIKNMSTNGISSRLISMEFNCEIEDIQNIIDNE